MAVKHMIVVSVQVDMELLQKKLALLASEPEYQVQKNLEEIVHDLRFFVDKYADMVQRLKDASYE